MLGSAGLAVTRKSDTCDGAKLGEVSPHFMLIESMGYVPRGKGVSQRNLDRGSEIYPTKTTPGSSDSSLAALSFFADFWGIFGTL